MALGVAVSVMLIAIFEIFIAMAHADVASMAVDSTNSESQASHSESVIQESGRISQSNDQSRDRASPPPETATTDAPGSSWTIHELLVLNAIGAELFPDNAELAKVQRLYPGMQKHFVFPDGEKITIAFHSPNLTRSNIEHLDDGVSGGFFEPLSEAARDGNVTAALDLYTQLRSCSSRATTRAQLNERIRALKYESVVVYDMPIDEIIAWEEQDFRRCEGTSAEMMDQAVELLRPAAEAGDVMSMFNYAREVEPSNPDLAEKYYRQVWERGRKIALHDLGRIYSKRPHPSYQDAVLAYAYSYAAHAVDLAVFDGLPEELFKHLRDSTLTALKELEASNSYSVVLDGTALAREIITNNPKCCT